MNYGELIPANKMSCDEVKQPTGTGETLLSILSETRKNVEEGRAIMESVRRTLSYSEMKNVPDKPELNSMQDEMNYLRYATRELLDDLYWLKDFIG